MASKGKRKPGESKILRVITSPRLRMLESKTSSKANRRASKEQKFAGGGSKPPMFNPLAGP